MGVKTGDWVRFWTNNWPTDATVIQFSASNDSDGTTEDVTGKGLYSGRGKVVRVTGGNMLVREERSNRIVELSPEDRIEPMTFDYHLLTLGDLRKFLESHRDAPDDIPVTVSLPVLFNCDDESNRWSPDHSSPDFCSSCFCWSCFCWSCCCWSCFCSPGFC